MQMSIIVIYFRGNTMKCIYLNKWNGTTLSMNWTKLWQHTPNSCKILSFYKKQCPPLKELVSLICSYIPQQLVLVYTNPWSYQMIVAMDENILRQTCEEVEWTVHEIHTYLHTLVHIHVTCTIALILEYK